jgi:hypothetical protein
MLTYFLVNHVAAATFVCLVILVQARYKNSVVSHIVPLILWTSQHQKKISKKKIRYFHYLASMG